MTEILLPSPFALNSFMGSQSQSGNIQDLTAYPGHTIVDSEPEPDSSSRQEFVQPPSLPSDIGLRYMTIPPATEDARFSPDSIDSPVYSIEPAVQTLSSSTITFSPYTNIYQQTSLNGSTTYSSGSNSLYSTTPSLFSMTDLKPRLGSLNASPGMMRSPALPHLRSPHSTRDTYAGPTPNFGRPSDFISRSPSAVGPIRGVPLSPTESRSGFTSPTNMENSGLGGPPLQPTEVIHQFQTADGQLIRPEIFGKIDKGFFLAESDWTCYRRNYFSLNCSYTLHPAIPNGALHLVQNNGPSPVIYAFAMSIAAVVDGRGGKPIELVQHTPKRDKGPQEKPPRIAVAPRPTPILPIYGDGGVGNNLRGGYDPTFGSNPGQTTTEATFERIQFKNATANNGKRRAAQQYYHLLVELFADLGQQHPDQWVKVATRMSAPMVVRGRSPGHYQSERRESNASIGPGGSGAGGSGNFSPGTSSSSRGQGELGGGSSIHSNSNYGNSYDSRSNQYGRNLTTNLPMEPTMSAEDARGIEETRSYLYYPAAVYEGQEARFQLPTVSEEPRIKQEYNHNGYILPSLTTSHDNLGRHCGRWEGVPESRGYFPTTVLQHEMSMT